MDKTTMTVNERDDFAEIRSQLKDWNYRLVYARPVGPPRFDYEQSWVLKEVTPALVAQLQARSDAFWSICRWSADAVGKAHETLAHLDAVRPFLLDIDWHDRAVPLRRVLAAVGLTLDWFNKNIGITDDQILCWFSGRGFHIVLPAEVIAPTPRPRVGRKHRDLAHLLLKTVPLKIDVQRFCHDGTYKIESVPIADLGVYQDLKLIRVPGSVNPNSRLLPNLRKVRVPTETLRRLIGCTKNRDPISLLRLIVKRPMWSDEEWA